MSGPFFTFDEGAGISYQSLEMPKVFRREIDGVYLKTKAQILESLAIDPSALKDYFKEKDEPEPNKMSMFNRTKIGG